MKATVSWKGGSIEVPFVDNGKESDLWKPVAQAVAGIDFWENDTVVVTTDRGTAILNVSIDEDGRASVAPGSNKIYFRDWEKYQLAKLVKIDVENNVHELYELHPNNMGEFTMDVGAKWGQTGGGNAGANKVEDMYVLKSPWKPYFYWVKYYQLVKNGYEDVTEMLVDHEEIEAEFEAFFGEREDDENVSSTADPDSPAIELYKKLQESAQQFLVNDVGIEIDFFSSKPLFNRRQINSARKKHEELLKIMDEIGVDEKEYEFCSESYWNQYRKKFNNAIEKLIVATAIKFKDGKGKKTVKSFMLPEVTGKELVEKMAEACEMWESTICAMEAMITTKDKNQPATLSPFGNIDVRYATEEEKEALLKKFNANRKHAYRVYMLDCHDFKARQEKYAEENGITRFEQFIHGSPTPNWISLIKTHPLIHPGIQTAGKAYGWGIYTARDFNKSVHYTSFTEGFYAGGNSTRGFIGVARCAYGNPYFPKGVSDCEDAMRKGGFNCVDAKAEYSGFCMDEIVFYDEPAVCFEAIIEVADCEENL